jgi:hypothetical protein
MNVKIDDLLTRMEGVSARAIDSSDSTLHDTVNMVQVRELIRERGSLLNELAPVLASDESLTYSEWNRLVVIHHQGVRLQENLINARNKAAFELGGNARGRVFLERITSLIAPFPNQV